jgi:ABC-type bacteriocin/lantibiotic exporter with double-glycine peptidase domain
MRPTERFFKLLGGFKKEVGHLYFYAMLAGLVSLSLPLGLQAIIQFVMAGQMSTSLTLLVVMVVVGIAISGYLQIMQLRLAENIQQQIFARGAFEFAFRIPRIKLEALQGKYAPEVINRFFDVPQVQKGLAKVLIDFSIASLQVVFGLLLLSVYHPLFIALSALLLFSLYILFKVTGLKGMETSILESKYKYKTAFWLQELARSITTFKVSGETEMANKRLDKEVNSYIHHRKSHFNVLMTQYTAMVILKVLVAATLLGLGVFLVIDRQINLGQFVAAEIIILLVLGAVEKLLLSMDVIYDLLTSLSKVGEVTDIPLDEEGGFGLTEEQCANGIELQIENLSFTYANQTQAVLSNFNLQLKAGEKVALVSGTVGGKTTLLKLLAGFYGNYSGLIKMNKLRLEDIDRRTLHRWVGECISTETVFHGSLYDNIVLGRDISKERVLEVMDQVGLTWMVDQFPDGLHTEMMPEGKQFSKKLVNRIIMARAIVRTPGLVLYEDLAATLPVKDREQMNELLVRGSWTLLAVTNDENLISKCDRVIRIQS